ncbi:MAG: hypothetical protein AAGA57_02775 [Planctomycetota bacterium]
MAVWDTIGVPLLVVTGLIATFEAAMAVTVMTVPDRRKRPWTPRDRARVRLIWSTAWGLWPLGLSLYAAARWTDPPWTWAAQAALVAAAVWAWLRVRRGYRRAAWHESGCCPNCGYDLRGNPDADHCAECGQPIHEDLVCPDTGRLRLGPLDPAPLDPAE